jgi:hypothetical protein
MDTKNFLMSKTFQGLILMVLTLVLPKLGITLGDAEMNQVAMIVLQALAALWIAIGRIAASKGVSLGVGQPTAQDGSPGTQSGPLSGQGGFIRPQALIGLCSVLAAFGLAVALLGGCSLKNVSTMSGPEKARAASYELMLTWKDVYTRYQALLPSLSVEGQQQAMRTVAPAINKAKPAVLSLAAAADVWSLTQAHNATGQDDTAALAADAQALITNALDLLQQVKR